MRYGQSLIVCKNAAGSPLLLNDEKFGMFIRKAYKRPNKKKCRAKFFLLDYKWTLGKVVLEIKG